MKRTNSFCRNHLTGTLLVALLTGTWTLMPACGDENSSPKVDIRGKSVEQAAEDIASALCHHMASCGNVTFSCSSSCDRNDNCTTSCTGTIEPITYDECLAKVQQDFQQMLECAEPTEEEQGQISACVNDTVAQRCLSQKEIDAMAKDLEQGNEVSNQPASCESMQSIFDSCVRDDAQPGTR